MTWNLQFASLWAFLSMPVFDRTQQRELGQPGWLASLGLLAAFSSYAPLGVWANNVVGVGHWERLLILIAGVLTVAISVSIALVAAGARRTTALFTVGSGVVVMASGGSILVAIGTLTGTAFILVFWLAASLLVSRIPNHLPLFAGLSLAAIFLIAGPVVALVQSYASFGESNFRRSDGGVPSLESTPDFWLIVLDGYAGSTAYRQDGLDIEPIAVSNELEALGFKAYESAWASYPTTTGSVPNLLEMEYILSDGDDLNEATVRDLYRSIGGDNALMTTLKANGYTTTMIESGWSGSRCGLVDRCVVSPFLDEAVFKALQRSVFAEWVANNHGYAFTAGARGAMDWLMDNAVSLDSNNAADFVFGHIMAPHPPFFLDEDCEVNFDYARSGVQFSRPIDTYETRVGFYEAQARCIDRFMLDFARLLGPDSIVVFVGDHGTDSRNQLLISKSEWGTEEVQERMNAFLAVKAPGACETPDGTVIARITSGLIACLAGSIPEAMPSRIFIQDVAAPGEVGRMIELAPNLVREFIESRLEPAAIE